MAAFEFNFFESTQLMQVVLAPGFTHEDWPELDAFYKQNADREGIHFWDLDMREVSFINSMLLGLLVTINGQVQGNGREFRLLVNRNSKTAEVIRFAKLHRIINVRES